MYNMLKMKKMNGLKIFALVLLSLSKFETMFGMKGNNTNNNIKDEYVNKNYYLIDDLGNKIILDNGEDIKFKIYLESEINVLKRDIKDILKIHENGEEKTLVITASDNEKEEEIYLTPILYKNSKIILKKVEKTGSLYPMCFDLTKENREKYKENTIRCIVIKKIGDDSINGNYILVDTKNNKIEIKGKNIVFKLLTRKKYLDLKKKLINPKNYLKNEKNQYILNESQNPLFFEEGKNNDLILYVKRLDKDNLCLASLDLEDLENPNPFIKNNYIKVHMAKAEEILEEVDSSKCCCGIC